MNTILTKYYDIINDELFKICPIGQWLEASEELKNMWNNAIRQGHEALKMTDEEFYNFLKSLEDPGNETIKTQFIDGFEKSFMKTIENLTSGLKAIAG